MVLQISQLEMMNQNLSHRLLENNSILDLPNNMKPNRHTNHLKKISLSGLALASAALFGFTQSATASTYTWNTTSGNWSSPSSWTPTTFGAFGPLSTDSVVFGNADTSSSATTVNNTVDTSFAGTVSNLTYNSVASGTYVYDVTLIPNANKKLTVASSVLVGGQNEGAGAFATFAYMYGAGTFYVTGPTFTVQNYGSASGANACAYLNLTGLTNFVYNNASGSFNIENVPGSLTRLGGTMFMAGGSNNITASSINLGTSTSAQAGPAGAVASGYAGELTLGPGTNVINVGALNIANQKSTFVVTNSGGGLRIRGVTGADNDSSDNITIGNKNVNGGTGVIVGSMMLNGCTVNIKAGTLIVGENINGQPSSLADGGTGILQFDTGTISANTVIMADNTSANNGVNLAGCNGTIQVGPKATLLIGAGQVFDLVSATTNGSSTGTLIISNGLVNCLAPLSMGPNYGGTNNGSILFLLGGTLNMGPNSYIGVLTNPVTSLTLATGTVLSVSIPSVSYTNICVSNLNWPTPDNNLTISVAAMPAGLTNGVTFALLNFSGTMTGTFTDPTLSLPGGVQGYLSLASQSPGNTMFLTVTNGLGPGQGGVNQLFNPDFTSSIAASNWVAVGGASIVNTGSTYPNTGSCGSDTRSIVPLPGSTTGTNIAKLTGSFTPGGSINSWSQSTNVTAGSLFSPNSLNLTPGALVTAGGYTYVAHEDIMSGADSFYYELDFLNSTGGLVAAYESTIVSNLTCGEISPFPLDTWNLLGVTNQMQVTGGVNTGVTIGSVASVIQVPPLSATATFKAVLVQRNATDSGSVYFSGGNVGLLTNAVPPAITVGSSDLTTLSTNTTMSSTVSSSESTISSVQVVAQTTTLGGTVTNTTTYNVGSLGLGVSGIGTSTVSVNLALTANTIYPSVIVYATDADGLTTSVTNYFDTLAPNLVIEASDFNFSGGQFIDTPTNGGLALYQGKVGTAGIDEQKATRTAPQSYYRPSDAIIMQNANPNLGTPPSLTEQKFITAAANSDTVDVEQELGFSTPGDWVNYTRTYGAGGSAPAGTYNVWAYLATSGTGVEIALSQVTSSPLAGSQTTNFLGNFGSAAFTDTGYNNFVYTPLLDQYGNVATVTLNGQQTLKATIVGNPNIGFYMLVPVAPINHPVTLQVSPNGNTPFQATNNFTFTVGPAQGANITNSGIQLFINGANVTSGATLAYNAGSGDWTVTYAIQSNSVYSVNFTVTNVANQGISYSSSFDTFNINNYQWEAVDYDFSTNNGTSQLGVGGTGGSVGDGWTGGLFIDNPVPTGDTNLDTGNNPIELTNSYFGYPMDWTPFNSDSGDNGAVSQESIDMNYTNASGITHVYRNDTVGTEINSDYLRPKFVASQATYSDPNICEFDLGWFDTGFWVNYTRHYPTNSFNVWGRLAGGAGAFKGTTLSSVTSGLGTSNQTTTVLGSFADPNAAGWQTWHWIELLDTNGNPAVVTLDGLTTLRLTSGNNLNVEFMMLVPATLQSFPVTAVLSGNSIQISAPTLLNHNYTLYHAATLQGTWTAVGSAVAGTGSVYTFPLQSTFGIQQGYYQVRAQ